MWMTRLAGLLMALAAMVPGVTAAEADNPFVRKLPFESATITYVLSGTQQGSEILYVADYGERSATYHKTVTTMMGTKMAIDTIEIKDPDWVYSYNLIDGTGSKSRNPLAYMQEEFAKLSADEKQRVLENSRQYGLNVMAGMGGRLEENAVDMLGYSCDRMSAMGTVVYSIHGAGIPLKTESDMMGMKMANVATAVDTGVVAEKYFKHPDGIEAVHDEEIETMSRQMAQQTMAWLKDPEALNKTPQMGTMDQPGKMMSNPQENQELMKQMEEMMRSQKGAAGN